MGHLKNPASVGFAKEIRKGVWKTDKDGFKELEAIQVTMSAEKIDKIKKEHPRPNQL